MLAMVACGEYDSAEPAVDSLVEITHAVYPEEQLMRLYNEKYSRFKKIYPSVKNLFKEII